MSPIALVTGASRGIGAGTAVRLAERGCNLAINYHEKARRAQRVVADVEALGRQAIAVQADLTNRKATRNMFERIREEYGRLDVLILNASGGLEDGKPADYAMRLNRDAQTRAVKLASKHWLIPPRRRLMPAGGRIVFVTSDLAHHHGQAGIPAVPQYEPVAESKRAGEEALRKRIPALRRRGISLVVVTGGVIEGTVTPRLLERRERGLLESLTKQAGGLTSLEKFATAIADAALDPTLESGATVLVRP